MIETCSNVFFFTQTYQGGIGKFVMCVYAKCNVESEAIHMFVVGTL